MNRVGQARGATTQLTARLRRAGLLAAVLVNLAAATAACASGSPGSTPSGAGTHRAFSAQSGPVTRGSGGSESGNESAGSFSLAFAKCMRAHGVPNFPDPNARGAQLGPGSGIDPTSSRFQAALNGPCESLAPLGWVSSGPVQKNGGGS